MKLAWLLPRIAVVIGAGLAVALLLGACGRPQPTASLVTVTPLPTATIKPTPTPTQTVTPLPSATPAPTDTVTPIPTATPTLARTLPPTATAEPTEVLKPTRTPAPTLTPTPLPDFSRLGPSLQDLPAGFQTITLAEAGFAEDVLRAQGDVQNALAFRIVTQEHVQKIVIFYATFATRLGDLAKDPASVAAIAKATLLALVNGYTKNEPNTKVEVLQVPPSIGEFAEGRTFTLPMHEAGMEAFMLSEEIVVVQRGIISLIVVVESVQGPGFTPAIAAPQLAKMLDDQLTELMP